MRYLHTPTRSYIFLASDLLGPILVTTTTAITNTFSDKLLHGLIHHAYV